MMGLARMISVEFSESAATLRTSAGSFTLSEPVLMAHDKARDWRRYECQVNELSAHVVVDCGRTPPTLSIEGQLEVEITHAIQGRIVAGLMSLERTSVGATNLREEALAGR
jgi:hypothetical protein